MPSATYRRVAAAADPDDVILEGVVLTHPDAPAPVRLVNDGRNHVIEGERFFGARLAITWPDESENRAPRARLTVDNVGRLLTQWIEVTRGVVGGKARFLYALATGAVEASVTLDVAGASVDASSVSIALGFGLTLTDRAVLMRHTPTTSPGIF